MNEKLILREFGVPKPRPLPVILLLDASCSMNLDGKIHTLNHAVEEMLGTFDKEDMGSVGICVGAVAFGGDVRVHLPVCPATEATEAWRPLRAGGNTPLGKCLNWVQRMLEDRAVFPSRAYRPTIVLVSDGQPNDEWKAPMKRFLDSPRGGKALRVAMAIGRDADMGILRQFVNDPELEVFHAREAGEIYKFFRWVTLSVTAQGRGTGQDLFGPLSNQPAFP
jgi:uncharacterized protein YegL